MVFDFVGVLTFLAGFVSLYVGAMTAIQMFVVSTLFGAAAALTLPGIGASIQPAHVLLGFLTIAALREGGFEPLLAGIRFPTAGFWFMATLVWGALGAAFFPRFFIGGVDVNAIGSSAAASGFRAAPIAPSSGNLTQTVYFAGDLLCFLVCANVAKSAEGLRSMTRGLLIYASANLAFAVLDIATSFTGTGYLLDVFRNASYVIYSDATVGDLKRVVGSFTEASSFAYATMGSFAFCLQLATEGVYTRLTLPLAGASLLMLAASTSTTAYVAMPVFFAFTYLQWLVRFGTRRAQAPIAVACMIAPIAIATCVLAIFLYEPLRDAVGDFLNAVLIEKSSSQSGMERSRYNLEAFQTLVATSGLGAGLGSVRASSFVLAVLSNLGLLGATTYGAFLCLTLGPGTRDEADRVTCGIKTSARSAALSLLIASSFSGALVDLGLPFYVLAALAYAPSPRRAAARLTVPAPFGRSKSRGALGLVQDRSGFTFSPLPCLPARWKFTP